MQRDISSKFNPPQINGQRQEDKIEQKIYNMVIHPPLSKKKRSNWQYLFDDIYINPINSKNTVDEYQNCKKCIKRMQKNKLSTLFVTSHQKSLHPFRHNNLNVVGTLTVSMIQQNGQYFRKKNLRVKEVMHKINNKKTHLKVKQQDEKMVKDNWQIFTSIVIRLFPISYTVGILTNISQIPVINQSNELLAVINHRKNFWIYNFQESYLQKAKNNYSQKIRKFQQIKNLFGLDRQQDKKLNRLRFKLNFIQKLKEVLNSFQLNKNLFFKACCINKRKNYQMQNFMNYQQKSSSSINNSQTMKVIYNKPISLKDNLTYLWSQYLTLLSQSSLIFKHQPGDNPKRIVSSTLIRSGSLKDLSGAPSQSQITKCSSQKELNFEQIVQQNQLFLKYQNQNFQEDLEVLRQATSSGRNILGNITIMD